MKLGERQLEQVEALLAGEYDDVAIADEPGHMGDEIQAPSELHVLPKRTAVVEVDQARQQPDERARARGQPSPEAADRRQEKAMAMNRLGKITGMNRRMQKK